MFEAEWLTRKKRIDPLLTASGWTLRPFAPSVDLAGFSNHAIEEFPTASGPADYALVAGGRLLSVVEAKNVTLGPQNVLTQAERYARGIGDSQFDFSGCKVPFLYSTNGEILWFHDVRHPRNRSRRVAFPHTGRIGGDAGATLTAHLRSLLKPRNTAAIIQINIANSTI